MAGNSAERATERVAVLMTPAEKAVYVDRASVMGLSLGQFFREAGAAYLSRDSSDQSRQEVDDCAESCEAVECLHAWLLDRVPARGSMLLAPA